MWVYFKSSSFYFNTSWGTLGLSFFLLVFNLITLHATLQKMSTFNKYMIKKIKVIVTQPLLITMVTHSSRSSLKMLTHKNIYLIHNLVHTLLGLFLNIIHLFYSSWRFHIYIYINICFIYIYIILQLAFFHFNVLDIFPCQNIIDLFWQLSSISLFVP